MDNYIIECILAAIFLLMLYGEYKTQQYRNMLEDEKEEIENGVFYSGSLEAASPVTDRKKS